jgi:hypothetical protein
MGSHKDQLPRVFQPNPGRLFDRVKRSKELEKENDRLRKAVSDLTLEKLILKEAADKHVHDSRLGVRFLNVVVALAPMPTPTT